MVEGEASAPVIVALRNEKGSYNKKREASRQPHIVALRNEKGSYNGRLWRMLHLWIVALRNEKDATSSCNSNLL